MPLLAWQGYLILSFPIVSDSDAEKSKNFKAHRKAHYDEFLKVKELRRKGSVLDEDEDDGDDKNGRCESSSSGNADAEGGDSTSSEQPSSPHSNGT